MASRRLKQFSRKVPLTCFVLMSLSLTLASSQSWQQRFEREPEDQTAVVGETVVLACRVLEKSGILRWTKNGNVLGSVNLGSGQISIPSSRHSIIRSDEEGNYSLQIKPVTLEDDGLFQCQVRQGRDPGSEAIQSRFARLVVNVYPEAPQLVQGQHLVTTEHREVKLECISRGGKPPAEIKWLDADGNIISDGVEPSQETQADGKRTDVKSVLKLIPKKEYHNKNITCQAQNAADEGPRVANILLEVKYAPKVKVTLLRDKAVEFDSVQLSCQADANPANVSYKWYINNEVVLEGSTSELTIHSVNRTLNGAVVKCEVENAVDKGEGTHTLNVQYGPVIRGLPQNVEADVGSNVTLQCEVEGNPTPEVTWTHERIQGILSTGPAYTVLVTPEMVGRFFCTARVPGFEEVTANATVLLKGTKSFHILAGVMGGINVTIGVLTIVLCMMGKKAAKILSIHAEVLGGIDVILGFMTIVLYIVEGRKANESLSIFAGVMGGIIILGVMAIVLYTKGAKKAAESFHIFTGVMGAINVTLGVMEIVLYIMEGKKAAESLSIFAGVMGGIVIILVIMELSESLMEVTEAVDSVHVSAGDRGLNNIFLECIKIIRRITIVKKLTESLRNDAGVEQGIDFIITVFMMIALCVMGAEKANESSPIFAGVMGGISVALGVMTIVLYIVEARKAAESLSIDTGRLSPNIINLGLMTIVLYIVEARKAAESLSIVGGVMGAIVFTLGVMAFVLYTMEGKKVAEILTFSAGVMEGIFITLGVMEIVLYVVEVGKANESLSTFAVFMGGTDFILAVFITILLSMTRTRKAVESLFIVAGHMGGIFFTLGFMTIVLFKMGAEKAAESSPIFAGGIGGICFTLVVMAFVLYKMGPKKAAERLNIFDGVSGGINITLGVMTIVICQMGAEESAKSLYIFGGVMGGISVALGGVAAFLRIITANKTAANDKSDSVQQSDQTSNNDSDQTSNNDSDQTSNNDSDQTSNNDSDQTSNNDFDLTSSPPILNTLTSAPPTDPREVERLPRSTHVLKRSKLTHADSLV